MKSEHIIENQTFSNLRIHLDFKRFRNCKFIDCELVFHGFGSVELVNNAFNSCVWLFEDASSTTMGLLKDLYNQGQGGEILVEEILKDLKKPRRI